MGWLRSWQGEIKKLETFWLESLKGRDHSEFLEVDGRVIIKRILEK
jgi:hypothetical protein